MLTTAPPLKKARKAWEPAATANGAVYIGGNHMKIDDILTLAKAGFTAEQIAALAAAEQPETPAPVSITPQPAADPAQTTQPAQAGQPAENTHPEKTIVDDPTPAPDPTDKLAALISAGFEELTKKMNTGIINPSMGDIKPHGIDDIITNFFKED